MPLAGKPAQSSKILKREQLRLAVAKARAQGKTIVQCHGCFDLVHPGHIRHLQYGKQLGDILLVSITGDNGMNKGDGRPLIPQELRAENLAALDCVDWVYIDTNPTAVELLNEIRPDAYLKGREYEHNNDPRFASERAVVEEHGGRVVFSSGDIVFSSTALIASMTAELSSDDPTSARLGQLAERKDLSPTTMESLMDDLQGKHILIIGELIRDCYVHCDRPEVASEAAMMTLRPLEKRYYDGGAGIIARHIVALGGRATIVTAAGNDNAYAETIDRLRSQGINVETVQTDTPMLEKHRYLAGRQKVVKIDFTQPIALDGREREQLQQQALRIAGSSDGAIICDYGSGMLTPSLMESLCRKLRSHVPIIAGDVSGGRANLQSMQEIDVICPNETELREAMRDFGESLNTVVWRYLDERNVKSAVVTLGEDGLIAFEPAEAEKHADGKTSRLRGEHIPAMTRHVVDELGCGDALLALLTLARAAGSSLVQSAYLGSLAATVQVEHMGNIPVTRNEITRVLRRLANAQLAIVTRTG